jgi:putative SOS response-associated peptidase YedK
MITVPSSEPIQWLHNRMPAVLRDDEEVTAWLHGRALHLPPTQFNLTAYS